MQAAGAQVGPLPAEEMVGQTQNPRQGLLGKRSAQPGLQVSFLLSWLHLSSTAREDSSELSLNTEMTQGCPSPTALGALALPRHQD